jgi:hypothetical protein
VGRTGQPQPGAELVNQICEPVLAPFRRILPNLGGLDISPIFAFIALKLIDMLVIMTMMPEILRLALRASNVLQRAMISGLTDRLKIRGASRAAYLMLISGSSPVLNRETCGSLITPASGGSRFRPFPLR